MHNKANKEEVKGVTETGKSSKDVLKLIPDRKIKKYIKSCFYY